MESEEDLVKKKRVVEARARNISHNVRCTECGSQSIEDSQADIAILLRKVYLLIVLVHIKLLLVTTKKSCYIEKWYYIFVLSTLI